MRTTLVKWPDGRVTAEPASVDEIDIFEVGVEGPADMVQVLTPEPVEGWVFVRLLGEQFHRAYRVPPR
mgnify:CR=1 FL=1